MKIVPILIKKSTASGVFNSEVLVDLKNIESPDDTFFLLNGGKYLKKKFNFYYNHQSESDSTVSKHSSANSRNNGSCIDFSIFLAGFGHVTNSSIIVLK
jgi:hypothetical protein